MCVDQTNPSHAKNTKNTHIQTRKGIEKPVHPTEWQCTIKGGEVSRFLLLCEGFWHWHAAYTKGFAGMCFVWRLATPAYAPNSGLRERLRWALGVGLPSFGWKLPYKKVIQWDLSRLNFFTFAGVYPIQSSATWNGLLQKNDSQTGNQRLHPLLDTKWAYSEPTPVSLLTSGFCFLLGGLTQIRFLHLLGKRNRSPFQHSRCFQAMTFCAKKKGTFVSSVQRYVPNNSHPSCISSDVICSHCWQDQSSSWAVHQEKPNHHWMVVLKT